MPRVDIRVRMEGQEVAKWCANHRPKVVPGQRISEPIADLPEGLHVISMSSGLVKDLPIEDWPDELQPSEVAYLDPKANVELGFHDGPWCEGIDVRDNVGLTLAALALIEAAMGNLRPEKLQIEIERHP